MQLALGSILLLGCLCWQLEYPFKDTVQLLINEKCVKNIVFFLWYFETSTTHHSTFLLYMWLYETIWDLQNQLEFFTLLFLMKTINPNETTTCLLEVILHPPVKITLKQLVLLSLPRPPLVSTIYIRISGHLKNRCRSQLWRGAQRLPSSGLLITSSW